jgi:hypothetical protein
LIVRPADSAEAMGGRAGATRIDRKGEIMFEDVAYLWDDITRLG